MIKIENLNKYFNRYRKNQIHVINNTSLTLEDTGLVALLGPSGSGKTTLLNAIGGLDKVKSGKIYINNKKITSRFSYQVDKLRNLNIGYIFQDYKLVDNLSVYDNVALVLKMIGIKDKKEIDKRVTYVLEKVGMYRYKKRPANMLSGGERQRVGIARAIVKNPNIIIADEPTGNLDSKNSIEIMNIIKAISKDRLVILVTHEVNLAKFYASRIIELSDGKIVNDYKNEHDNELDYSIDNRFYLKDFTNRQQLNDKNYDLNIYSDDKNSIKLDIIIKNGNIYIQSKTDDKIEVIDESSNIEIINDHYKKMDKEELNRYKFNFKDIINEEHKLHYSSIFNPITFITNGFKKIFDYSFIKKILLIGFFLSGCFILLGVSRIAANMKIEDKDFVKLNVNYLTINTNGISAADYNKYKSEPGINYIIPSDSLVNLNLKLDDFYQTSKNNLNFQASIAGLSMIKEKDIVLGSYPKNKNEIVIDKMTITNLYKNDLAKMVGLSTTKDILNKEIKLPVLENLKIVGIVDLNSPSAYVADELILPVVYNNTKTNSYYVGEEENIKKIQDYNLFSSKVNIVKGRAPTNDYETIVPIELKEQMKLEKEIKTEIDNHKLRVVGYYESPDSYDNYFVNSNMILYQALSKTKNITVYSTNKEETLTKFRDTYSINIEDGYQRDKNKFLASRRNATRLAITSSVIILVISFIEIILMLRSSFLSRVREVGIYRAIGVKKKDIYIMFSGEIIAITTLASVPGILFMTYILKVITGIRYVETEFLITLPIVLFTVLCIYLFNLVIGLIPVYNTIRKTPAQILSRTDI